MLVKKWKMPLFVFLWNYMNGKQVLYKEKKSVIFIVFFQGRNGRSIFENGLGHGTLNWIDGNIR